MKRSSTPAAEHDSATGHVGGRANACLCVGLAGVLVSPSRRVTGAATCPASHTSSGTGLSRSAERSPRARGRRRTRCPRDREPRGRPPRTTEGPAGVPTPPPGPPAPGVLSSGQSPCARPDGHAQGRCPELRTPAAGGPGGGVGTPTGPSVVRGGRPRGSRSRGHRVRRRPRARGDRSADRDRARAAARVRCGVRRRTGDRDRDGETGPPARPTRNPASARPRRPRSRSRVRLRSSGCVHCGAPLVGRGGQASRCEPRACPRCARSVPSL